MLQAFANWRWDQLHEGKFHDGTLKKWSDKRNAEFRFGHRDGIDIIVAEIDFDPKNDFLKLKEFFGSPAADSEGN